MLAPQVDEELYVSKVRKIHCAACDETFYAAELRPVCPTCGRVLVVKGGH